MTLSSDGDGEVSIIFPGGLYATGLLQVPAQAPGPGPLRKRQPGRTRSGKGQGRRRATTVGWRVSLSCGYSLLSSSSEVP